MKKIAACLLMATAGGGCLEVETDAPARVEAPAAASNGEIAFQLMGPGGAALVLPVHINGQGPYDFVLDTGATLTCIEQEIARELELPRPRGVRGVGAGIGSAGQVQLVQLDSVRVGDARAEDLSACALDLAHTAQVGVEIDGLLGLNFLKAFHVTIDFEREVLVLRATP